MLAGKNILLGVSGGIAAYKAAELVRLFVREEASVNVVMTANARQFVTPLTFQALSSNPVGTDLFNLESESRINHIYQARQADLVVIAPATANVIAKLAAGIADDYLTTIILATTAPVLVCPAMNVKMYEHPATRRNIRTIRELGYFVHEPGIGSLACKEEGPGRLPDPEDILETSKRLLISPTLANKRVLVSAGPTWEFFDPVRFISNPSSGKMGYAMALAAARRAAEVHLVSGPSALRPPAGVQCHPVRTALEMRETIVSLAAGMDVIVMAAAVGDYRPSSSAPNKLKKRNERQKIILEPNPDILAGLGREKRDFQLLVGFAAETENLIENAREKLERKNLDFIVANDLTQKGAGFACDTNIVKLLDRSGAIYEIPCGTKEKVAEKIWDRLERRLLDIKS